MTTIVSANFGHSTELNDNMGPLRKRKALTDCVIDDYDLKPLSRPPMSKAREVRLEQNRKAARESRKRKKAMVEELQRSVIFFSRANAVLKQQNEELNCMLINAKVLAQQQEKKGQDPSPAPVNSESRPEEEKKIEESVANVKTENSEEKKIEPLISNDEAKYTSPAKAAVDATSQVLQAIQTIHAVQAQAQSQVQVQANQALYNQQMVMPQVRAAQALQVQPYQAASEAQKAAHQAQSVATQAILESQGFPTAAARAAAQSLNPHSAETGDSLSSALSTVSAPAPSTAAALPSMAINPLAAFAGVYPALTALAPSPFAHPLQAYAAAAAAAQLPQNLAGFPYTQAFYPAGLMSMQAPVFGAPVGAVGGVALQKQPEKASQ